jgi:glyoxylase-like metal-dependent hydrolase (beta-lactamase superfamily II)
MSQVTVMNATRYVFIALAPAILVALALAMPAAADRAGAAVRSSQHPEIAYLEAVNAQGPPRDPQLLFLLMAQYSSAHAQERGVEFFSARLNEFDSRLTDVQRALYLSAIGLLRAERAPAVPLLRRIRYVKDTLALLEQARQRSGGQVFVVNWIAGVVHARVPGFFRQTNTAREELEWCIANANRAPHSGWLREVYRQLAVLARAGGDQGRAQDFLRRSGYQDLDTPITLTTPFSEEAAFGHAFAPRRIVEVVPHRVYALSGFEFTEYYFIVSDDGRELIGIDAGTRADAAKSAYEALRAHAPGLPELTTILVTHSHWDHVGGHRYFRAVNPNIRFYARSNYHEEIARELDAPEQFGKQFFGAGFEIDAVRSFKPDVTIDRQSELTIGGTRIELIPVQGGETHDALFIHLPAHKVLFVGDFIMPYLGAPFVPEGDLSGLLDAIDVVVRTQPQFLLHGHEPLTRNFASVPVLAQLRTDLGWLRGRVQSAVRRGDERASIHAANLVPPGLLSGNPDVYLPYLLLREHVIDRLYDQSVGYWQADLQGLEHLGRADQAELLVDYLELSEPALVRAVERLVADGKYELAASLLDSSRARFEGSDSVARIERVVYLKLMEKHQNSDPFKFIIYAAKAGEQVPQMSAGH